MAKPSLDSFMTGNKPSLDSFKSSGQKDRQVISNIPSDTSSSSAPDLSTMQKKSTGNPITDALNSDDPEQVKAVTELMTSKTNSWLDGIIKLSTLPFNNPITKGATKGLLETAAGGEAMVRGAVKALTPKSWEKKLDLEGPPSEAAKKHADSVSTVLTGSDTEAKDTGEKIGKFGEAVLELATPAGGEKLSIKLATKIPEAKALLANPKIGKAAQWAVDTIASMIRGGAEIGTQEAIKSQGDMESTGKAVESGIIGGGIGGGILMPILEKGIPAFTSFLEKTNLRLTPTQKREVTGKIKNGIAYLEEKKYVGTPSSRLSKVSEDINSMENTYQTYLKNPDVVANSETITKDQLKKMLDERKKIAMEDNSRATDVGAQYDRAKKNLDVLYGKENVAIPIDKLNKLKRSTYDNAYDKVNNVVDPYEHDIADALKTTIENATNKSGIPVDKNLNVQDFNKLYGSALDAKKLLWTASGRSEMGLVAKMLASYLGSKVGAAGGVPGMVAGATLPLIAGSMAGTLSRSLLAKGLSKIDVTNPQQLNVVIELLTKELNKGNTANGEVSQSTEPIITNSETPISDLLK